MNRIWINIGLGFLTPFIAILGAEPFEVPGQNPLMERVGAGVAALLYCGACQFWFARQNAKVNNSIWSPVVAMVLMIAALCLLQIAIEGVGSLPYFAGPVFIAGFIGSVVGMFLGRGTRRSGDA